MLILATFVPVTVFGALIFRRLKRDIEQENAFKLNLSRIPRQTLPSN